MRVMYVMGGVVRSGVDSVILTLSEGLRKLGHVPVISPLGVGLIAEEARQRGFTVAPLAKQRRFDVASIPRLASMIRRHRIDIVHSHEFNGAFYACPAGRLAGVAQVNSWHIPPTESLKQNVRGKAVPWLIFRHYLWQMRHCREVITVSGELRDLLVSGGVPRSKVTFIPTAVDLAAYEPRPDARRSVRSELGIPAGSTVIGTAGRIQRQKNLPMLLHTARRLLDEGHPVRVVIVGDGSDRAAIEQTVSRLGLREHVVITGWRQDVPRVMQAFDIFALTSTSEGMPIVVLEAMAMEKPVVGTRVGAMADCVQDGRTGFLVPSGDVDRMASALTTLLRDPSLCRRFGSAGRVRVERDFSEATMVKRHMDVYYRIRALKGKGKRC